MKILALKAKNFKNLKAVSLSPNGQPVTLTGKNGAGKSAVLDAICAALTGQSPAEPIRHGQTKAEIVVQTERFTVRKTFSSSGRPRLEVTNADGAKYPSPQALLDEVIGNLSFDPLAFDRLAPKAQHELLSHLVGVDLSTHATQRMTLYDRRTAINREITTLTGQLAALPTPAPDTPEQEASLSKAIRDLELLTTQRQLHRDWRQECDRLAEHVKHLDCQITEMQQALERLHARRSQALSQCIAHDAQMPPEVPEETYVLQQQKIAEIESTNRTIRAAQEYRRLSQQLDERKAASEALTADLAALDQAKLLMLAQASMPVEGLSLDEEQIRYQGTPYAQLSTGERLRVSTAITMSLNPRLRVLFVRDGSLLDAEGMTAIAAQAKAADYQLWLERVDDTGTCGIVIEDGEIRVPEGMPHEPA